LLNVDNFTLTILRIFSKLLFRRTIAFAGTTAGLTITAWAARRELYMGAVSSFQNMISSKVLQKLRAGDFVVTAGINRVAEPWLAEVVGRIGFDVIWFDMEHRAFQYDQLNALSLACRATGIDLMVRVRKTGYTSPMQALEFGANGILVPHVMSVEEARQWVEWVRFPPLGRRGFDGAGADAEYALSDPKEYLATANDHVFLALQVEDRECVECVEEIAALPGVDLLFVGPGDLSISYGVPFQFDHPLVQGAIDRVANAAAKAGNDHLLLLRGFQKAYADFQNLKVPTSTAA
jgi:4-hydroxy-2-oxoheptanedioate aldolase